MTVRILAVLCTAFLLQLACSADSTSPELSSDEEAKQCLMQHKRKISKSDKIDEKPQPNVVKTPKRSTSKSDSESEGESFLNKHVKKSAKGHNKKGGKKHKHSHGKRHHKHHDAKKKQGTKKTDDLVQQDGGASEAQEPAAQKKDGQDESVKPKGPEEPGLMQVSVKKVRTPLKDLLPEPVLAVAWKLFKTEGAILGAIENSVQVNVTHAGVPISLRMNKFDDATTRLGSEGTWFSYDLDTLADVKDNSQDVLNMIDVGGNYGVVTIAAMKKYPNKLRVVTVEPIPTTFFFLKWNLHINGVPEIEQADWDANKATPGVLALNSGSSDVDGQSLHFCSYPWSSMNSKMCDCKEGEENCLIIPSTTVDALAGMFGNEPISMVKMDCEGCEFKSLPALAAPHISQRVRRLAGELHIPDKTVEELACRWDHGRLMTKCQFSEKNPKDVECDVKLACPY